MAANWWPYAVLAISAAAAVGDLVAGRIPNWLTAPAFLIGIAVSFVFGGWSGGAAAVLGGLAGLALFGWMFWLGVIGGGDVKLLMAVGVWGGSRYCTGVALLSIMLGGGMALLLLGAKGRLRGFFARVRRFFTTLLIPELEMETLRLDRELTMPFGIPIAAAAVWSAFGHPLAAVGLGFLVGGGP